jgi:hypothetical protein
MLVEDLMYLRLLQFYFACPRIGKHFPISNGVHQLLSQVGGPLIAMHQPHSTGTVVAIDIFCSISLRLGK